MNKELDFCQIEWADSDKKRARKVISRSNAKVTHKYPSWKSKENRMLHCESRLEKYAFMLHDADPAVDIFWEQPVCLKFYMEGEMRIHFPDIYVESNGVRIFKEVKNDEDAKDLYVIERTKYLSTILPMQGYSYELMAESQIKREPRLSNVSYLLKHGRKNITEIEKEILINLFVKHGQIFWGDIKSGIFGKYGVSKTCNLILRHVIKIDTNAFWEDKTPLTLNEYK